MLTFNLNGDILEVKESLFGFTSTKITHWYYDIQNWTKSLMGKKDEAPTLPMTDSDIEWVKKHYLPKVQSSIPAAPQSESQSHHPIKRAP